MSATSCVLSEDQFLCCICLDIFTDPVTIPCGHNFCKGCILHNWNVNNGKYQCPMCKKLFNTRPDVQVNTFISEMTSGFKQAFGAKGGTSDVQVAKPGEIPCDVCTGTKLKAVKSCSTCLASYCGIHLDHHQTCERLQTHTLTDPVGNMDGRVCKKHHKALELFCKSDQTHICSQCTVTDHGSHSICSLQDVYNAKKLELQQTEEEIQQMIQQIQLKSQQIKRLKAYSKEDAEREIANSVEIFTTFTQAAEKNLNSLLEAIEARQKRDEETADGHIKEMQEEACALQGRAAEIQRLLRSEDHLQLIQGSKSFKDTAGAKNWTTVDFLPQSLEGTVGKAVGMLEETFRRAKEELVPVSRLRRVQDYSVEVTLEPLSANLWLTLSQDGKQVCCGHEMRSLPDNEERFYPYLNVFAQQTFSAGRFYYEVQVTGKTDWTLGVAQSSMNRKAVITISPANGYWTVGLKNGNQFLTMTNPVATLRLNSNPQRVGVFVSYEEGLVSFYDVDESALLYSFTNCSFTDSLCPVLSPGFHHGGINAAPLIISAVRSNT